MLRRAENVTLPAQCLVASQSRLARSGTTSSREQRRSSGRQTGLVNKVSLSSYFRQPIGTSGSFRAVSTGIIGNVNQVYALLVTRGQREQQRIERAQAMVAMGTVPRGRFGELYRMTSSNTCGSGMKAAAASAVTDMNYSTITSSQ